MTLFPCAVQYILLVYLFYTQQFISLNNIYLSCPSPLHTGNHQLVFYESALLYSFVCLSLLNSTNKWQYGVLKRIFKFLKEFCVIHHKFKGLPCSSNGKESACIAGDWGSIPGSRRSSGGGKGNPLQYSCLENPMDMGA